MAVVRVPKTPKSSFDKHRRPSALLLKQIEHLQWAALPASKRDPHQMRAALKKVKTEAQASKQIERLTKRVLSPADQVPDLSEPRAVRSGGRRVRKPAARRGSRG